MPPLTPDIYGYNATVISTGDGDTIKLDVLLVKGDFGFHVWLDHHMPLKFRLYGLNAPPAKTPEGKAATVFLAQLLPPGTQVWINSLRNKAGSDMAYKYGDEWMAIVWRRSRDVPVDRTGLDLTSVNDQMVDAGHAVPWDGKGPRPGGMIHRTKNQ